MLVPIHGVTVKLAEWFYCATWREPWDWS